MLRSILAASALVIALCIAVHEAAPRHGTERQPPGDLPYRSPEANIAAIGPQAMCLEGQSIVTDTDGGIDVSGCE